MSHVLSEASRSVGFAIRTSNEGAVFERVEFVPLSETRVLVVIVARGGHVIQKVIDPGEPLLADDLRQAANYLNAHIRGLTLSEARARIEKEMASAKAELDKLTQKVIEAGLATWSGTLGDHKSLIVRGQANLLKDIGGLENLERIRQLFADLETKSDLVQLLGLSERGEGVHIFIGSENKLFSLSGSSLIVAPFEDQHRKVVGVLGVIGPTRLNYARIIPMVDYTAKLVGRLLT